MRVALDDANGIVDRRDADVDAARLVASIRDPDDDRVACPTPGPAHAHLGWLHPDLTLNRRAAFAAVARSRGATAPRVGQFRAVAAELRSIDAGSTTTAEIRERAATAGAERDRLRERVATLQGEVRARREAGLDASDATDELAAAARELSAATTEREAARQALARARETARVAYDRRERRLRLQDRAANLQRAARATLADRVRPEIVGVLDRLGRSPLDEADDPAVALAAATVATFDAPVVLELDRDDPGVATRAFDVPVVRL